MERRLFGTDGIRAKAGGYPLDTDTVSKLASALTNLLKSESDKPRILMGHDSRESGPQILKALNQGISDAGGASVSVGVVPTPVLGFLTRKADFDAGIIVTASHNPWQDNGIKIFRRGGIKLTDDEELEIEKGIFSQKAAAGSGRAMEHSVDDALASHYARMVSSVVGKSLVGIKLMVDCANGATSGFAPAILRSLGAEVHVICDAPDGRNINESCGALHPEKVSAEVVGHYADAGLAYDGDGDRLIVIDEKGNKVDGDVLLMAVAMHLKSKGKLKKDILVSTVMGNLAMDAYLKRKGISLVRTPVGDRYVLHEILSNGYSFGGENSGHLILGDYSHVPDGILASVFILGHLRESGMKLSDLLKDYRPNAQILINSEVERKVPLEELRASSRLIDSIRKDMGEKGRVFVRYSGTENKVRVLVEGPDQDKVKGYAQSIIEKIREELG